RNVDGSEDVNNSINAPVSRGYTDHEHLPGSRIINMNGRMYDPELGRHLSADPYTPDPFSSQGYNRYSYVHNNPLRYIDPSGYYPEHSCFGCPEIISRYRYEGEDEIYAMWLERQHEREEQERLSEGSEGSEGGGGGGGGSPNPGDGDPTPPDLGDLPPPPDVIPDPPDPKLPGTPWKPPVREGEPDPTNNLEPPSCASCTPAPQHNDFGWREGIQLGLGTVEFGLGLVACASGSGCVAGIVAMGFGADDIYESLTGDRFLARLLDDPQLGRDIDMILDLTLGLRGAILGPAEFFIKG